MNINRKQRDTKHDLNVTIEELQHSKYFKKIVTSHSHIAQIIKP